MIQTLIVHMQKFFINIFRTDNFGVMFGKINEIDILDSRVNEIDEIEFNNISSVRRAVYDLKQIKEELSSIKCQLG